jgi:chromosome segregation ATPase
MKARSQMVTGDGFDKNVAEKMPKIRRLEEPIPSTTEAEPQPLKEDRHEMVQEMDSSEKQAERKFIFEPPKKGAETKQNLDVLRLIEDLHAQLLVSSRTKRALEMDLSSYQKTIHQLIRDNQDLRRQFEDVNKELQRLKEIQSESVYLKEENEDALERIREFQQELLGVKEVMARTTQERDEALSRIRDLELQIEQSEIQRVKGRLKEREASHFSEENQELQSKLEEALAQNLDLEKKYDALRRSFNEVRESLALLRDSCKKNYYNLSETPE